MQTMFQKEQQNGKKICALCMEFFCILMAEMHGVTL
jgi:NADH:ubiquinone oxidoreductase subunit E